MNFINRFLQPLSQANIHLGRWNILNHHKTVLKLKYATEDNCFMTYHTYDNAQQQQTHQQQTQTQQQQQTQTPQQQQTQTPQQQQTQTQQQQQTQTQQPYSQHKQQYIHMMGYESVHD